MKRFFLSIVAFIWTLLPMTAQTAADWQQLEKDVNFIIGNDLGRNGYYDQKPIADLMGRMAEAISLECVATPGDVFHYIGVRSTSDPLWMTNFELVYNNPELLIPWYPTLGNHEYRGTTQAVLDYSHISSRWQMPARYYTKVLSDGKGDNRVSVRLVLLDTPPIIDKYRNDTETYPDAYKQDYKRQLAWADSVLTVAKEDWVIVLGHHPIYADTNKDNNERTDMQARLNPVLKKHKNVSFYVCGHIHNFQHLRKVDTNIDYVVNTSGSQSRSKVNKVDGTQFCYGGTGFSLVCANKTSIALHLIDREGKVVYTINKRK